MRHALARIIARIIFTVSTVSARLLGLRQRYVVTRDNRLRLRYIVPFVAVILAVPFAMASFVDIDLKLPERIVAEKPAYMARDYISVPGPIASIVLPQAKPPYVPKPKEKTIAMGRGDTVAGLLQKKGVPGPQAYGAVKALSNHFDPRKVRSGQKFFIRLEPDDGGLYYLANFSMEVDPVKKVEIARIGEADYQSTLIEKEVKNHERGGAVQIENSFYGSALKAGIPEAIVAKMIHIYSWDIDFQRDIRQGDTIEVLYETVETQDGEVVDTGNVLYAAVTNRGKEIPMARFEMKSGKIDYFDPKGRSIRKQLMKTPVDGARISSGYGMRRHPVLGYNKMHKGMDFAAPTGTPIYAAGDGVVEKASRFSSFGNYIRIRHNGSLKTAYAHLNGYAKGVRAGTRVEQGQVIGYVGSTGRSTGPHLHYEVHLDGRQVNPGRLDLPTGEQLESKELETFKALYNKRKQKYVSVTNGVRYASAH